MRLYFRAQSSLVDPIWARQFEDELFVGFRERVLHDTKGQPTVDLDGVLSLCGGFDTVDSTKSV